MKEFFKIIWNKISEWLRRLWQWATGSKSITRQNKRRNKTMEHRNEQPVEKILQKEQENAIVSQQQNKSRGWKFWAASIGTLGGYNLYNAYQENKSLDEDEMLVAEEELGKHGIMTMHEEDGNVYVYLGDHKLPLTQQVYRMLRLAIDQRRNDMMEVALIEGG